MFVSLGSLTVRMRHMWSSCSFLAARRVRLACPSPRSRPFSSSTTILQDVKSRSPFNPFPAFQVTRNPEEGWSLGDGLRTSTGLGKKWKEDEEDGWKTLNLDKMDKPSIYKLLTSAVVPRPIAFVSTLSEDGVPNLAPFSYFSLVAHNPPLVSISFNLPAKRPKDTRENIKATKEFVVNIISEPFVEAANSTSIEAPAEIDEWVVSGLTPEPSGLVKPPRVRESAVSLECKLFHILDITPTSAIPPSSPPGPETTHTLVLGRIHRAHIRQSVISSSSSSSEKEEVMVDANRLRAVSRLGGTKYARVGEGFEIERPSWRKFESVVRGLMADKAKENGATRTH